MPQYPQDDDCEDQGMRSTETCTRRTNYRSQRELRDNLLREIEACERRAHKCGALVTAHALNRAKNALGWEVAGNIEQAAKAARGDVTAA